MKRQYDIFEDRSLDEHELEKIADLYNALGEVVSSTPGVLLAQVDVSSADSSALDYVLVNAEALRNIKCEVIRNVNVGGERRHKLRACVHGVRFEAWCNDNDAAYHEHKSTLAAAVEVNSSEDTEQHGFFCFGKNDFCDYNEGGCYGCPDCNGAGGEYR